MFHTHPAPQVRLIAPADIDTEALPRDRRALDTTALTELETSILLHGLRQPIEVFARTPTPDIGPRFGLISGLRRLTVARRLGLATVPAFLRTPQDGADAMAQMIAENEMRAEITPWEKGRIVVASVEAGVFDTLDAAVARLFQALDRNRRTRIRATAEVVAEIGDHLLTDPRTLTQNQLVRIAFALRNGYGPVIEAALGHSTDRTPDAQWRALLPVLAEAEAEARTPTPAPAYRPGRPRRVATPRKGLRIRRERTADGWILRFSGPDATGPLMEDIMDHIEQQFGQ